MAKFCINCGNQMEDTHRVCSGCGTPDQQIQGQPMNNGQPMQGQINNQPMYGQPMNNQAVNNQPMYGQPVNNQPMNNGQYYQGPNNNMTNNQQVQEQGIQYGWVVLGFFIPLAGWILWGVWSKTKPQTAKACGIAGIIGFIVNMLIIF